MAKAPAAAAAFDGSGAVWFKVKEVTAQTDGGKTINWPSLGKLKCHCPLCRNSPLITLGICRHEPDHLHHPPVYSQR